MRLVARLFRNQPPQFVLNPHFSCAVSFASGFIMAIQDIGGCFYQDTVSARQTYRGANEVMSMSRLLFLQSIAMTHMDVGNAGVVGTIAGRL